MITYVVDKRPAFRTENSVEYLDRHCLTCRVTTPHKVNVNRQGGWVMSCRGCKTPVVFRVRGGL